MPNKKGQLVVLIVEDNEIAAEFYRDWVYVGADHDLDKLEVLMAGTMDETLEILKARQNEIDLSFWDNSLPDGDTLWLIWKLRDPRAQWCHDRLQRRLQGP